MIKVGDTLYRFDMNRRRYTDGGGTSQPDYRYHFEAMPVVGETSKSWLANKWEHLPAIKVNKTTLREAGKGGYSGYRWFTAEGMEADIWMQCHRRNIVHAVEIADGLTLRKIAEIVGYKEAGR